MTLLEILNQAKKITGSDPKTAEAIGIHKGLLSTARSGKRPLPIDAACNLAELINQPWYVVVAAGVAYRCKDEVKRTEWLERASSDHASQN